MFGYNVDKRAIYIMLAILVIFTLANMSMGHILDLLITIPAVIIAISFHEFAHAYAADKLGDTTPRAQGRLTLNPAKHIDPTGLVLLMFAHIGWGKPVEINPNNFTSNKSRGACEAIVSFAGPLMNFIIAIIGTVLFYVLDTFMPANNLGIALGAIVLQIITINIGLGVFNLIPLPPLDGEKIFRNFLPYRVIEWLDRYQQTIYMIFLFLWIFNILGYIVEPVISFIFKGMFNIVGLLMGAIFKLF